MTKLTRRFTQKEIKLFREEVFKAVHEGRLPGNAESAEYSSDSKKMLTMA